MTIKAKRFIIIRTYIGTDCQHIDGKRISDILASFVLWFISDFFILFCYGLLFLFSGLAPVLVLSYVSGIRTRTQTLRSL